MSSFLDKILESKEREIADCKSRISLSEVERLAAHRKEYRGFEKSLNKDGVRIISEIKRASPSRGAINSTLSPAYFAQSYAEGGAAALSVLTEPIFFKGSASDLREARGSVEIPVLRKDFILEPYQVYETAAIGADAMLLIVRILKDETLHSLYKLARNIGLDVLTEVFGEDDARRAAELKATLVGINNRDLAHFSTDVNHALRISALLPKEVSIVTASGIQSRNDIELNLRNGIRRFLIGEALVKQPNPVVTLRDWIQQNSKR